MKLYAVGIVALSEFLFKQNEEEKVREDIVGMHLYPRILAV